MEKQRKRFNSKVLWILVCILILLTTCLVVVLTTRTTQEASAATPQSTPVQFNGRRLGTTNLAGDNFNIILGY